MKFHSTALLGAVAAVTGGSLLFVAFAVAAPSSAVFGGKTYYVVNGNSTTANTGEKVCASIGKTCVGYTGFTNNICKIFHPNAKTLVSVNGSKAGFYCDGAPQKGLACEKTLNTCQVCPACNVNMDCKTAIGTQFREMYVECGGPLKSSSSRSSIRSSRKSSAKSSLKSSARRSAKSSVKSTARRSSSSKKAGTYGPLPLPNAKLDPRIGTYPGTVACEFYQVTNKGDLVVSNKKLVTCGAYKAADNFCVQAMQSRFAKSVKCEDHGIIICTNPCNPPEYQVPLKQCAFDNDRPRGKQAPPLSFCTSSKSSVAATAKKKAGELCQHGGQCNTGNCVGEGPDFGKVYRCSCNPFRLDYTCGK